MADLEAYTATGLAGEVDKADFFGHSNGASITLQIGISKEKAKEIDPSPTPPHASLPQM